LFIGIGLDYGLDETIVVCKGCKLMERIRQFLSVHPRAYPAQFNNGGTQRLGDTALLHGCALFGWISPL
jgi:hypothetical protein